MMATPPDGAECGVTDRERLEAVDLSLRRRRAFALTDIHLQVRSGELLVLVGPNGSGKSTIVRCLSRLVEPTAGEITIDGEDILALSERVEVILGTTLPDGEEGSTSPSGIPSWMDDER